MNIYFIRSTEIPKINIEIKRQKLIQTLKNIIYNILEKNNQDFIVNISSTYNLFVMDSSIKAFFKGYNIEVNIEYFYSYDIYNKIIKDINANSDILNNKQDSILKTTYVIDMDAIYKESVNNINIYYQEKQNIRNEALKIPKMFEIKNI